MKKIFTPFAIGEAGTLKTRLEYSDDIQTGYSADHGKYRGFKTLKHGSDDYIFAPPKSKGQYGETHQLEQLRNESDQLYINGHCNRGLQYLASDVKCG